MIHKCIKEINEQLTEHNGILSLAIDCSVEKRELIQLSVEKLDLKVRKKPPALFASYCPFCGKALKGMV